MIHLSQQTGLTEEAVNLEEVKYYLHFNCFWVKLTHINTSNKSPAMTYKTRLELLKQMSPDSVWMFAVDGKFHASEQGPNEFEKREAGSVAGILSGLAYSLQRADNELTVAEILTTHRKCMNGVKSRNPVEPGAFRTTAIASEMQTAWMSQEGLQWFNQHKLADAKIGKTNVAVLNGKIVLLATLSAEEKKSIKQFAFTDTTLEERDVEEYKSLEVAVLNREIGIKYFPPHPSIIQDEINLIVSNYNQKMNVTSSRKEKLFMMACTIQKLVQLHPFRDGNNRTFINCVLARMLYGNFNQIPLFFDPNVFEFHSPDQLVNIIEEALARFDKLLTSPQEKIFNFDYSKVDQKFVNMGKVLLQTTIQDLETKLVKDEAETAYTQDYLDQLTSLTEKEFKMSDPFTFWKSDMKSKTTEKLQEIEEKFDLKLKIYTVRK